jgi:protocatechuate 3,4-dioxygenase beta subunit
MKAEQPSRLHRAIAALLGWASLLILAQTALACGDPPEKQEAGDRPKREAKDINVLRGLVVDHEGRPVRGAEVALADAEVGSLNWFDTETMVYAPEESFLLFFSRRNGRRSATTTTDEEGRFQVRNLKLGTYNVAARHRKRGAIILGGVAIDKAEKRLEIKLNPPVYIRGTIKGLPWSEEAHSDCRLSATGHPRNAFVHLSLDNQPCEEGLRFRVGPVPDAEGWTLTVSRFVEEQWQYSATVLEAPVAMKKEGNTKIAVDLTEGEKLSGRVRGPEGEPLAGVSVVAKPSLEGGWTVGAVTDKEGKYTIQGLPDGKYTLEANRWRKRTSPG